VCGSITGRPRPRQVIDSLDPGPAHRGQERKDQLRNLVFVFFDMKLMGA
jgi:hypothetical protein